MKTPSPLPRDEIYHFDKNLLGSLPCFILRYLILNFCEKYEWPPARLYGNY